jgi:glycine betaine/choline ABC-type transport system substrate-binding protein
VIRQQVLQQHAEIEGVLDQLSGKISDAEMQKMNYLVDGQHRDTQDVVREFLRAKNLIP